MENSSESKRDDCEETRLVASAAAGDSQAFSLLVSRYNRSLKYAVNSVCPDRSEREDLTQEGLIGLLKAVRTYDGSSSSFSTYAFLCMKNSVITAKRKYCRQHIAALDDTIEQTDTLPDAMTERSPEDVLLDREMTSLLYRKVMELLSEYERRVFELYLDGVKTGKVADMLGKDAKSVGNAIFRIRKKLSAELNKYIAS